MKKIGFLSFGHWTPSPQSATRSAADALLQSIDLAVAAEELGADGAYFRVHHFARQLASPFPLLAAVGAKTKRIEIGTAVIDMRYENPLYMVEDAGAADLIAGGRLQLGISRGSPEQVIEGWRYFGYQPRQKARTTPTWPAAMPRRFSRCWAARASRSPTRGRCFPIRRACCASSRIPKGLRERIWWGAGSNATAVWAASSGMNLQSSTLKNDETGEPFHVQQAAQIRAFRDGLEGGGPRARAARVGQPQHLRAGRRPRPRLFRARGAGRGPDRLHRREDARDLRPQLRRRAGRSDRATEKDEAIAEADTLLLTVPNQLGVDYNAHVIEAILTHVAPALGWR